MSVGNDKNGMNIIHKLFNEEYVINLFKKEVLPIYPCFNDIKKIDIRAHKNNIWEKTYHVVIEFKTYFVTPEGKTETLPIFCSAHSDEPREKVFNALKYLWDNGFSTGSLSVPHPLFYSQEFKATFYRGVQGHNLYHFIRHEDKRNIEDLIPKVAKWFSKLHNTKTESRLNFNEQNSLIKKVVPGRDHILESIEEKHPEYSKFYKKVYDIFIEREESFLDSTDKRWLIHGDAHPENIIKLSENKIAVIDFTDMCLSDFARDLGTFMQQIEFMITRKMKDEMYAHKMKYLFLEKYLDNATIKLDKSLERRIDNYYNWTAIRTATFFLIKYNAEPDRGRPLIEQVKKNLNI